MWRWIQFRPQTETFTTLQASASNATGQAVTLLASDQKEAAPAPSATPAPKPEIKSVVKYVNAGSLNVRKEANSNSELLVKISRGDKVTYYETQGEWARIITWSDKKGYVLAKYLVNSEKDVEKVAAETKTASAKVSRGTSETTASAEPASAEAQSLAEKIINYAKTLQGVKYVWSGTSTKGVDCSGLTTIVFEKYGIYVPRSSGDYYGFGTKVARSDLRAGDIVLWDIDGGTPDVGHVGIYLGNGTFIHASSSKGKVVIANLATYGEKYMGARRVIK